MTSRHIIYDIICTVFMSSLPRYLTLHPQYLCPHNPSKYDLWTTVCMTSHPLYIWHLRHHTERHIHSLSSHHCSNHLISTAFITSHTLYTTSHTWQNKSYICHLTLFIWHDIHCICVIKPSVSIVLHPLSVWHYTLYIWPHIQCACHHMNNLWHHTRIGMTSTLVCLWYHIQYIWYHPYCFTKTIRLYLASHPLYLTSQPLHLCGHTHSINAFTTIMEVFTLGKRMTS